MYEEKTGGVTEFGAARNPSRAGYGFGRQGEKAAGLKGQFSVFILFVQYPHHVS